MDIAGEVTIAIAAPAATVWTLVSDVERMGEWSPETFRAEWLTGNRAVVGARFKGCNRLTLVGTWCSECTVTTSEPGRTFGFVVGKDASRPNTEWEYRFKDAGEGACLVTERYRMIREPPVVLLYYRLINRRRQLERGVTATLARLKVVAEAQEPVAG